MCNIGILNQMINIHLIHYTIIHTAAMYIIYRIRTNIGEELNLVNWRIIMQSPSLNLAYSCF